MIIITRLRSTDKDFHFSGVGMRFKEEKVTNLLRIERDGANKSQGIGLIGLYWDYPRQTRTYDQPSFLKWGRTVLTQKWRVQSPVSSPPQPTSGNLLPCVSLGKTRGLGETRELGTVALNTACRSPRCAGLGQFGTSAHLWCWAANLLLLCLQSRAWVMCPGFIGTDC